MKLTPTMQKALDLASKGQGKLERWPGGFWTYPECPTVAERRDNLGIPYGVPEEWVSAHTVNALLQRRLLRVTELNSKSSSGYPIAVEKL